ncbi:MAG: hypothetical protein U0840_25545 [Gemmataceae bacterium]
MRSNVMMSDRKPKKSRDRRVTPKRMVRVHETLCELLEGVANRRLTDLTAEVERAVRELLEREGLWPPPDK